MPTTKIEVRSKKLDGPANRPMTYDEITYYMRALYGECGRILLRDAADCADLVDSQHEYSYRVIEGRRDGAFDMICRKPRHHELDDPIHTFVTLLTDECIWLPHADIGDGA